MWVVSLPLVAAAAAGLDRTNYTFTEAPGSNPSLPASQDRLTGNVWLTRGTSQGLFNAATEGGFTHFLSPQGTEWADGSLANYATLSYNNWNTWAKGVHAGPLSTVGVNAVLHLIPDDIYLSIRFTSWNSGGTGGFSYIRSTPTVVPEPVTAVLLLLPLAAMAVRKRK